MVFVNGMYIYNETVNTGTPSQPDTLSLFIKKEKKDNSFLTFNAEPLANIKGKCIPILGSYSGILRIVEAVKEIFKNISNKANTDTNPLWNSFKNLFRGIAEACPFSGIFIIIYDAVRDSIFIHSKIVKEVLEQENVACIALDGKVIVTIDLKKLEHLTSTAPKSDAHRLAIFKELCLQFLKKQQRSGCTTNMIELFPKLKALIRYKYDSAKKD